MRNLSSSFSERVHSKWKPKKEKKQLECLCIASVVVSLSKIGSCYCCRTISVSSRIRTSDISKMKIIIIITIIVDKREFFTFHTKFALTYFWNQANQNRMHTPKKASRKWHNEKYYKKYSIRNAAFSMKVLCWLNTNMIQSECNNQTSASA